MYPFDLEQLTFTQSKSRLGLKKKVPPHLKQRGKFLKGPIPLEWLNKAANLPGKSLHVALALRFWAGIKKTQTVVLSNIALNSFGITRYSKKRALKNLELAGLVIVERHTGRAPIVTILDV